MIIAERSGRRRQSPSVLGGESQGLGTQDISVPDPHLEMGGRGGAGLPKIFL